jgi:hypothetical protein
MEKNNRKDILYLNLAVMMVGIAGVIGQYVGKTYIESKHRPRFFIDKIVE